MAVAYKEICSPELAVLGGPKVRQRPMPARRHYGDAERHSVDEVFRYYASRGAEIGYQGRFEQLYTDAFVEYLGGEGFADAVCTGTAGLYVALAALGLPRGSHVLVSPVTDPGTLSAIILNGLVPVVVDSMPDSYNMGHEQFVERLTPEVRAVMVVHLGGKAAPVDKIAETARGRGIHVIEDCSQAHGAKIGGRMVGTFGDIAVFSTMFGKGHGTGGTGGIVYSRHRSFYDAARSHADRGKPFESAGFNEKDPRQFLFPALNLNLDEISCAIGRQTLSKLDRTIRRRIKFVRDLCESLEKRSAVCRGVPVTDEDSPFFEPVTVDVGLLRCSKLEFAVAVREEGIISNPQYAFVVCEWPWVRPYLSDDFVTVNAIRMRNRSFHLMLNENYGKQEIEDIVEAICKVESVYVASERVEAA